jgi:hypothetical protein
MTTLTRWILSHKLIVAGTWLILMGVGFASLSSATNALSQKYSLPGTVDRASPETATTWMHACRRRPTSIGKESPMIAIWRMGPIAAAAALRGLGFSSQEANRLVELKLRCERGDLDDPTDAQKRLRFVRWLVQNGRLSEGEPVCWADGQRRAA